MATVEVPDFDDLPPVEGMPKGCAWGVFDSDEKKDRYGTLNFLTPEVVKAAAAEVKDGVSISLKYVLSPEVDRPGQGRGTLTNPLRPACLSTFLTTYPSHPGATRSTRF